MKTTSKIYKYYQRVARSSQLSSYVVTSDVTISTRPCILRDAWESFSEHDVSRYFEVNYGMFLGVLEDFKKRRRALTLEEQRELEFMLAALIAAKNSIYEYPFRSPKGKS